MANEKKTAAKKPLTEEQKKAAAERMRKARAAKKVEVKSKNGLDEAISNIEVAHSEMTVPSAKLREIAVNSEDNAQAQKGTPIQSVPLYDETTVQRMIDEALAKQAENAKPQVIQVTANTERVTLRWQAPVANYNVLLIGDGGVYGRITGPTGTCYVPKSDFSRVLDEQMRWYIENRWMLVVGGLTDDEREALNCAYKEGETLDKEAFAKMVEMGDEMLDIFPALCDPHREMVAQRYAEAYEAGDGHVTRDLVKKLNDLSKKGHEDAPDSDKRKRGLFVSILEKMNANEIK